MPSERNERAEKILRVATVLFHERGFGGVGVDQIGEGAGMSGPAIYRYFSGKDEILSIVIDEAIDRILMSVGGRYSDPAEELAHLIREPARRAIDGPELVSLWLSHESGAPCRRQYRTRLNARIDRWVECRSTCCPGHSRQVVLAAVHATLCSMSKNAPPVAALTSSNGTCPKRVMHLQQLVGGGWCFHVEVDTLEAHHRAEAL